MRSSYHLLRSLPRKTVHSSSPCSSVAISTSTFSTAARVPRFASPSLSVRMASTSAASSSSRPIVLCGPSGVGKSTLIKKLFADFPDSFGFSVSHTTRSPRPGEQEGVSYHYVSRQEFEQLIGQGAFLEYAQFGGNYYGTTAKAVEQVNAPDAHGKRRRALLDIDTQGVKLIKANHAYLDPLYIFIAPPSIGDLRKRLEGRGTETPESIAKRLAMCAGELAYAREGNHDVIVLNDDVERAYKVFKDAIQGTLAKGEGDQLPPKEKEEEQLLGQ